jgi:quinol monooxygenase YgiN
MATQDKCVTIVPYFKVHSGKMQELKALCEQFVEKSSTEKGCLYYGFSFDGDAVHCREGYRDADAALEHLTNVGALLTQLLNITDLVRLEIHGIESELAKLHGPLAQMKPQYFVLECGFRRA